MFQFAFDRLALADFNFDFCRRIVRQEASVAAEVNMIFLAEIVLVEQSFADACNADKKSFAS